MGIRKGAENPWDVIGATMTVLRLSLSSLGDAMTQGRGYLLSRAVEIEAGIKTPAF